MVIVPVFEIRYPGRACCPCLDSGYVLAVSVVFKVIPRDKISFYGDCGSSNKPGTDTSVPLSPCSRASALGYHREAKNSDGIVVSERECAEGARIATGFRVFF